MNTFQDTDNSFVYSGRTWATNPTNLGSFSGGSGQYVIYNKCHCLLISQGSLGQCYKFFCFFHIYVSGRRDVFFRPRRSQWLTLHSPIGRWQFYVHFFSKTILPTADAIIPCQQFTTWNTFCATSMPAKFIDTAVCYRLRKCILHILICNTVSAKVSNNNIPGQPN